MSKPGVWFVGLFLLPIIVAFTALKLDWLPNETTNHGAFLDFELRQPELVLDTEWTIAFQRPQQCDEQCQTMLQSLPNLYTALGKNQHKVSLVVLQQPADAPIKNTQTVNLEIAKLKDNYLYLVDKTGLFVLEYAPSVKLDEARQIQKGLLKDIKKLLNYSRSS